jgi:hypothetical protein
MECYLVFILISLSYCEYMFELSPYSMLTRYLHPLPFRLFVRFKYASHRIEVDEAVYSGGLFSTLLHHKSTNESRKIDV